MPVETTGGHLVELRRDGVRIKDVRQVRGLTMALDVVETEEQDPDGRVVVARSPGGWRPGELTVTRGVTGDDAFESWVAKTHADGTADARSDVQVVVTDRSGAPVKRYRLVDAWPRSLTVVLPDVGDRGGATEELVVSYARLEVG